jgi:LAO/AO transport system kinase
VSRGDPAALLAAAATGSRVDLARLLSAVESGGDGQRATAALAYATAPPYVIGITGPPGAGKSTLTDRVIAALLSVGLDEPLAQIAVLCVDPSSPYTGGAILGDRIRMQQHATDTRVFIRSLATRGHLGGLSQAVPDAVRVLGAAGFEVVLVETVGVGQMEVDIASAADSTIIVLNPGWGDSMQANKAGLLEVADLFVINKADRPGVREARRDLEQMLDLGAARPWRPPVLETVATSDTGTTGLLTALREHRDALTSSGDLVVRRRHRLEDALARALATEARARVGGERRGSAFDDLVTELVAGTTDPYRAAHQLLTP